MKKVKMNLKGQYNKLNKKQKIVLKKCAIKKEWIKYWIFKRRYLMSYEENVKNNI